jgi:DNA-binding transcriptional ArsR family regulator
MSLPHPIPDALVELIARRFHVLAEPMRIRLLDRLRDGEATVQELADELHTSQQNASKHLVLMAELGVLARRKERMSVKYRIADQHVLCLCEQICGSLEHQIQDLATAVGARPPGVPGNHEQSANEPDNQALSP